MDLIVMAVHNGKISMSTLKTALSTGAPRYEVLVQSAIKPDADPMIRALWESFLDLIARVMQK